MKMLRNLLGRVFAIWALVIFIITMLIFFIPILVVSAWKDPKRSILFQRIARFWMRIYFFLTGLRIRISGRGNFEKGKNYIVVSNHNSLMDVPLTTPFIPGANKTIAKAEMAKIPVFGNIYKIGSVLVDRKSEESRKASFGKMIAVLEMGLHMCIYPEGTRNKTGEPLRPFHNGAFRLAIETGKPVLPVVIFNTAKVLPAKKTFFFWPEKIRMHFLPPVEPGKLSMEELKEKVFQVMWDYYVAHKDQ